MDANSTINTLGRAAALVAALAAGGALAEAADAPKPLTPEERAKIEARMDALGKEMRDLGRQLGEDRRIQVIDLNRAGIDRAMIGVNVDTEASEAKGDGVHVAAVTPRGPAANAGVRAGDVIIALDGKSLKRDGDDTPFERLRAALAARKPGDEVKLKLMREGKPVELAVKTESYAPRAFSFGFGGPGAMEIEQAMRAMAEAPMPPMPPMGPMAPMAPRAAGVPGIERFRWFTREWGDLEMVSLSPKLGEYFGAKEGVLVVHAPADGASKLQDGDVIQKVGERKPASPEQVLRILRSYDSGETLKLEVLRNRKTVAIEVKVPQRGPEGESRTEVIVR